MAGLAHKISTLVRRLRGGSDRGASLVEYALLVALIALVCFVAVGFLGESTSGTFDEYGNSLTTAQN